MTPTMSLMKTLSPIRILMLTIFLGLPLTGLTEDSEAVFRDNCLRCHTVEKVASTAAEGSEAEQRELLQLNFRTHPKKPVVFDKASMVEYLIKEFAARAKK
jgi:hypothetical protein